MSSPTPSLSSTHFDILHLGSRPFCQLAFHLHIQAMSPISFNHLLSLSRLFASSWRCRRQENAACTIRPSKARIGGSQTVPDQRVVGEAALSSQTHIPWSSKLAWAGIAVLQTMFLLFGLELGQRFRASQSRQLTLVLRNP